LVDSRSPILFALANVRMAAPGRKANLSIMPHHPHHDAVYAPAIGEGNRRAA
jgi:hypothetical protein